MDVHLSFLPCEKRKALLGLLPASSVNNILYDLSTASVVPRYLRLTTPSPRVIPERKIAPGFGFRTCLLYPRVHYSPNLVYTSF